MSVNVIAADSNSKKNMHDGESGTEEPGRSRPEPPTDEQIRGLITEALSHDSGLAPLKGFKLNLSANAGFRKFFYSAKCECGTAALLSLEIAQEKTREEVARALPSLVNRLESQAGSFYGMTCEAHSRMRMGPASNG